MSKYLVRYTVLDNIALTLWYEKRYFYFRSQATRFMRKLLKDKFVRDIYLICL